jgi:hypothetical protein
MNYISKIRVIVILLIATTFLTACQTVTGLNNMCTSDKFAYSCEQIYAALMPMMLIINRKIAGMVNVDGLAEGVSQVENPSTYFQRAKMTANLALIAQGCQPLG